MGNKRIWFENCPHCTQEMECYDSPLSLIWSRQCEECGYRDDRDYYETLDGRIVLLDTLEAISRGLSKDLSE
jgi:hypothetical protein